MHGTNIYEQHSAKHTATGCGFTGEQEWNLLRQLILSIHTKEKRKLWGDMLINLIMETLSQCVCTSNHHTL